MLKITPDQIVDRYWRYPWKFLSDGGLVIYLPGGRMKVFREEDYVPKKFRTGTA